jgi:hypothetical protein
VFVLRRTHMAAIRAHERERARWDTERRDLLDRIMYMADRPWSPPPIQFETPALEGLAKERYYLDGTNEVE